MISKSLTLTLNGYMGHSGDFGNGAKFVWKMSKSVMQLISIRFWNVFWFLTMKITMSKLKMLFWLFRSSNFWTPVSQDDSWILEVFGPENTLVQFIFASTNVLKLSLWPRTCNMPLLHIQGVTFSWKVDICKLVMFCHKYLIGRRVLILNVMQRPEKLF